jgi:SWI/SNF-related matrix-associated actin-dependent regulator 1 of chromatin subfamily A
MTWDICCPTGLSYFPYQVEGIEFALRRTGTLLGDEMGVGKTVQAAGIINALGSDANRILVVCPATMRLVWRDELKRWLVRPMSIGVAGVDLVSEQLLARVHVLVVNYDRLGELEQLVTNRRWDLAILDECHLVKNPEARRSQLALKIKAVRRLALSGTPMPNRPIELYPVLSWLDPEHWPLSNRFQYARRYCGARHTPFGWDLNGSSNAAELGELLRSTVMIRRTKAQVLPQLPPKLRSVIELDFSADLERLVKAELTAFERWQAGSKNNGDEIYRAGEIHRMNSARSVEWDNLSKARYELAIAKVPLIAGFVRETFAAKPEGKIVIFAHHREVIHRLRESLSTFGPVILYGGLTAHQKQAAIAAFQTDPRVRVFIGQIQVAGLGITLAPASSHCIFAELSWVPAEMSQAEDRLHRIGTQDNVLVQHLVLSGSLDATMARVLLTKQSVLDCVLGNGSLALTGAFPCRSD